MTLYPLQDITVTGYFIQNIAIHRKMLVEGCDLDKLEGYEGDTEVSIGAINQKRSFGNLEVLKGKNAQNSCGCRLIYLLYIVVLQKRH